MVLKSAEAKRTYAMVLDSNGDPALDKTISIKIMDESEGVHISGSMTQVNKALFPGLYRYEWTPDQAGEWLPYIYASDPKLYISYAYTVDKGLEKEILDDTNELQTDWKDGGRLDLLIDAIKAESESHPTLAEIEASTVLTLKAHLVHGTGDITPPTNKGIWNYLPYLTGNVALASVCTETRLAELDAANLPSVTDTILEDTNELQIDWHDGGRLDTILDSIKGYLSHGTYGLPAIENLVDEVESLLKNATYGLEALDTDIDVIKADTPYLADQALPATPTSGSIGRLIKDYLTAEVARHSVATEARLSELDAANIPADIDAILADTADMQPRVPRIVCHMDFWSDNDDEIALTTTSSSHNLPNCVVAGLPSGVTIIRVVALLKIALIKDTSGADNAINIATMALKVDAASDYSSTVTAIDIPDNSWAVDVSEATERGGDAMIGDHDIDSEVTGNGTYYARFETAKCDGNNLKLKDVAWGLRIYFTV